VFFVVAGLVEGTDEVEDWKKKKNKKTLVGRNALFRSRDRPLKRESGREAHKVVHLYM
jgi:hypothetical protein